MRRMVVAVTIVVGVVLVVSGCAAENPNGGSGESGVGTTKVSASAAPSVPPAPTETPTPTAIAAPTPSVTPTPTGSPSASVDYTVTADGDLASSITWGGPSGESEISMVSLPWSVAGPAQVSSGAVYSLVAQDDGTGTITCAISVAGTVVVTNSSSGDYSTVSCVS